MGFFARLFGKRGAEAPGFRIETTVEDPFVSTVKRIVGDASVCAVVATGTATLATYIELVRAIAPISGGRVVPTRVECTDDPEQKDWTYALLVQTEHGLTGGLIDTSFVIDALGITDALNDALGDSPHRFVAFITGGDSYAFAFATREQMNEAAEHGVEINRSWLVDDPWSPRHRVVPLHVHATGDLLSNVHVSSDEQRFATFTPLKVRIWNQSTWSLVGATDEDVTAIEFYAHDARLIAGTHEGVRHRDTTLGWRSTVALAVDRESRRLAIRSTDDTNSWFEIWNLETSSLVAEWKSLVRPDALDRAMIALSSSELATLDTADGATVWNLDGTKRASFEAPSPWGLAFSLDGTLVAFGAHDKRIDVHRVLDGSHVSTYELPRAAYALAFSPDGRSIAAATDEAITIVGREPRTVSRKGLVGIHGVRWLSNGDILTSGVLRDSCSILHVREPRLWLWPSVR